MRHLRTKLQAAGLLLILVLAFAVYEQVDSVVAQVQRSNATANIFNPVSAFLGIGGNQNAPQEQVPQYQSLQTQTTGSGNGLPFINTPAPNTAVEAQTTGQGSGSALASLRNRQPTLLCLPSPVTQGEEALIFWACRDGSESAEGVGFETQDAVLGNTRVTQSTDTTYGVICAGATGEEQTRATCEIDVANPALAIIATPTSVERGRSVQLSWQTKEVSACLVTSAELGSFERRGISGNVRSPALFGNTTFSLTCETTTGNIEERRITVQVN